MTIGIYALYWEQEFDLFYIGQSTDVQKRYREHINLLRNSKHSNYKLSNMFAKYGEPKIHIVEVCLITELDTKEIQWTNEFNSIDKGLNIISAGASGSGITHPSAKYSKLQILSVFRYSYLLQYSGLTIEDISNMTEVSKRTISAIRQDKVHYWLKERYPYLFAKMQGIDRDSTVPRNTTKEGYILLDPSGSEVHIDNMRKFARNNGLDHGSLFKVISGKVSQHKGYTKPKLKGN